MEGRGAKWARTRAAAPGDRGAVSVEQFYRVRVSPFPSSPPRTVPGKEPDALSPPGPARGFSKPWAYSSICCWPLGKMSFITAPTVGALLSFPNSLASTLQRSRASAVSYHISTIWGRTALMVALPGKKETGSSLPYPWAECATQSCCCPLAPAAPPAASCHPVSPSAILQLPLTFQGFKSIHFHFLSSFTCTVQATTALFSCCSRSSTSFAQVSRPVRNIGGQKSKPKSFARHL